MEEKLETKADELLKLIKERGKIELPELRKIFRHKNLERWLKIFEENGLIEIVYPENPLVKPFVKYRGEESENPGLLFS